MDIMLKKEKLIFIAFTLVFLLLNILGIILFVSPKGLNLLTHLTNGFSLFLTITSLLIIVDYSKRKYAKRSFLIVNILTSLISIVGLAMILYNLPFGFYLPTVSINGHDVDGTNQTIGGIALIVTSILFLYTFYVLYRAIHSPVDTKGNDEE